MIPAPPTTRPVVIVIDDDEGIREAIAGLLDSVGLETRCFSSVQEFQNDTKPRNPGCMVLDVRLPDRSGLDFFSEYSRSPGAMPVIFISAHADVAMSVRAMKAGAVEFLPKPVPHQELLEAVQAAISVDTDRRRSVAEVEALRYAFDTLTSQEKRVARLAITGQLNKQIAGEIGVSEATIKLHRGHVMQKMGARTLIDLLRMIDKVRPTDSSSR